ncbi:hypothetical protein F4678DRAFT_464358 [Xylaria arbuscula]|nr:hypothetical protein F4678DRAFT_464358 [Xylaria arbuscula]
MSPTRELVQMPPTQPTSSMLKTKIASLGSEHLVSRAVMTEYINKPTLVYISFWNEVLQIREASDFRKHDYGNLGHIRTLDDYTSSIVYCIVENHETAFSPLLASKDLMKLFKSARTAPESPAKPNCDNLKLYTRYHIMEGEAKPIDFHFLERFHLMNTFSLKLLVDAIPLSYDFPAHQWWPNLVNSWKKFFGIFAYDHVIIQGYYILINHKEGDERTRAALEDPKNHVEHGGFTRLDMVKSYDVTGKLPTDLTSAAPSDLDEEQQKWAREIDKCFGVWNMTSEVKPICAYFVRWKTGEELEEEENLDTRASNTFNLQRQLQQFPVGQTYC